MDERTLLPIARGLMIVDTLRQRIDIQQIDNRRFMYNPHTHVLILGAQYKKSASVTSSHAEELAKANVPCPYDDFVRGWIGASKDYPHAVIHFAPHIEKQSIERFERGFDALEMLRANGARDKTVVRGFGDRWEQPLSSILTPKQSVVEQLKENTAQTVTANPKSQRQER